MRRTQSLELSGAHYSKFPPACGQQSATKFASHIRNFGSSSVEQGSPVLYLYYHGATKSHAGFLMFYAIQTFFRQILKILQRRVTSDVFQRGTIRHVLDDLDRVAEVP